MTRSTFLALGLFASFLALPSCAPGETDSTFANGTCSVERVEDGAEVACSNGTSAFVKDGKDGADGAASGVCSVEPAPEGATITCGSTQATLLTVKGESGPQGPVGPQGPQGEQGAPGVDGADGLAVLDPNKFYTHSQTTLSYIGTNVVASAVCFGSDIMVAYACQADLSGNPLQSYATFRYLIPLKAVNGVDCRSFYQSTGTYSVSLLCYKG